MYPLNNGKIITTAMTIASKRSILLRPTCIEAEW